MCAFLSSLLRRRRSGQRQQEDRRRLAPKQQHPRLTESPLSSPSVSASSTASNPSSTASIPATPTSRSLLTRHRRSVLPPDVGRSASEAQYSQNHQRSAHFAVSSVEPSQDPTIPASLSSPQNPSHNSHTSPPGSSESTSSTGSKAPPTPIDLDLASRDTNYMSSPEMDTSGSSAGGGEGQDRGADAKSVAETTAKNDADYTRGATNRHPPPSHPSRKAFMVGVSEDRNRKCRRTMEDSHSFAYSFGGVDGQGYFAVFDGHAGKHAAEWCGEWFHEYLLRHLATASRSTPVPDLLNSTFHIVDAKLSQLAAEDGTHSGCTAVTALLRLENEDGTPWAPVGAGVASERVGRELRDGGEEGNRGGGQGGNGGGGTKPGVEQLVDGVEKGQEKLGSEEGGREHEAMRTALDDLEQASREREQALKKEGGATGGRDAGGGNGGNARSATADGAAEKGREKPAKRTLYTANVGDARAVLCRGGKAVRLTYDHKGSDAQEAKRITDAGGFVMNNRVNGVLAVTRSLGDSSMKEFVVGSPYTTETTLGDEDEFLIVACDGLWDVCEDQDAVDLIRNTNDPQEASQVLLDHALSAFSTDNLSVLVVSLRPST